MTNKVVQGPGSIYTEGQTGDNTITNVFEDPSTKAQFRKFFNAVDGNINFTIDSGVTILECRMLPAQIQKLESLIAAAGNSPVRIVRLGRTFGSSSFDDGRLGVSTSAPMTTELDIEVHPSMRE